MARRRVSEVKVGEDHDEVIAWYRERLSEPAAFPWVGSLFPPSLVGPTWQVADGHWVLPDASIGWDVLGWCGTELQHALGEPWRFTPEQARFVLWWYAVDADGRWVFRDGVLQRLKGWGKDPLVACLAYVEALGPCRVAYMDDDLPVSVDCPTAWVQLPAVSLEQTKNTMRLMPSLITPEARGFYGVQVGKELIHAMGDERLIQAVTSSPTTLEGARATAVFPNEALALDVMLPSPGGWVAVGDVIPGMTLFGTHGLTEVVSTTPVYEGRACSEVEFVDGETIVVDDGHLWLTKIVGASGKPKARSTLEMVNDGRRFAVPLRQPEADGDDVHLPLDPYALGYWLGDGSSDSAVVTVGDEDLAHFESEMARRGITTTRCKPQEGKAPRVSLTIYGSRRNRNDPRPLGFRGHLADLDLLHNKHIPGEYLRASARQRLALLQGLMDSDGCCSKDSSAIFVNQRRELADGVVELARSLGYRVSLTDSTDDRWGRPIVCYRVTFRADVDMNPFLIPRKAERVSGHRRMWKTITAIRPVESVPVKCIEVDAPDHLFCAGNGWTLTHNTQHWKAGNDGYEMAAVIDRNAAKSADGAARRLAITNAYEPSEDSVAQRDREAWEDASAGTSLTTGILYDSIEAPPAAPLTPEAAPDVVRAIRGDSIWLDPERIVQSILDTRNPPSRSRRFWYNQITAAEDAWVDPLAFDDCAAPELVVSPSDELTLFFDGSKSDDATALVACRVSDGHVVTVQMWQRPPKGRGEGWIVPRAEVDATVTAFMESHNVIGFFADPSHTRDDETQERFWDGLIDDWHRRWGSKLRMWAVPGKAGHSVMWDMTSPARSADFCAAAERCVADIENQPRSLTHDGDSRLRVHVHNARRYPNRYGVSLWKGHRESARKVDLAVCMVGARMVRRLVLNQPAAKKRSGMVVGIR